MVGTKKKKKERKAGRQANYRILPGYYVVYSISIFKLNKMESTVVYKLMYLKKIIVLKIPIT